jgi:hypothetical protein
MLVARHTEAGLYEYAPQAGVGSARLMPLTERR